MELETKRLILRKHRKSDWKDLVEGVGNYDVAKMLGSVPYPYTRKNAEDYIKKRAKIWKEKPTTDYVFVIELKSEKKVIGSIGLHKINFFNGVGTTGSWINKKYWGNGYVTEAKIALNDFAFNKLKLSRLESNVFVSNKASNAVQLKIGYKLEGTKRRCIKSLVTGKIYDENMYGLMKEEWKKKRPSLIKKIKNK
jgi:[ribosomal protein S5]-alanine N-acetyltransferase